MASVDWKKTRGASESKAMMRHSVTDERVKHEHANKQIDKSRTPLNLTFGADSYREMSEAYDERIEALDSTTNKNKRRDRVTMCSLVIPAPEGMPDDVARNWFADVYEALKEHFGEENVLGGAVHFDEVHEYVDATTHQKRTSRVHGHFFAVPELSGGLNCKRVSSAANMKRLNRTMDEVAREYSYRFTDGSKRKSTAEVEDLKNASRVLEVQAGAQAEAEAVRKQAQEAAERVLSDARAQAKEMLDDAAKERLRASHAFRELSAELEDVKELHQEALMMSSPDKVAIDTMRSVKFKDGTTVYDRYQRNLSKEYESQSKIGERLDAARTKADKRRRVPSHFEDLLQQDKQGSTDFEAGR